MGIEAQRVFLPIYCALYGFLCFVWRSIRVWNRTGVNPLNLRKADGIEGYLGRIFMLLVALICIVVGLFVGDASSYSYAMPIAALESPEWRALGTALLIVALALCAIAQAQMGASWRIGIETRHVTELKENGLYRFSRNPIYFSLIIAAFGFFFSLPSAAMLVYLALALALIPIQVRLEEEHLARVHGETFRAYCARVRRWV